MPTPVEWVGLVGGGALAKSVLDAALGRKRAKSDIHKADAESEKAEVEADAARIRNADELTEVAMKIVRPLRDELAEVREDLEAHKKADAEGKEERRRAAQEHMQWDNAVVEALRDAGIEVPPPPPLFEGGH